MRLRCAAAGIAMFAVVLVPAARSHAEVPYFTEDYRILPSEYSGYVVAVRDMNGDGHGDVLVLDAASNLRLWFGDGASCFPALTSRRASGYPGTFINDLHSMAVGDLNGDERPDVVASNYYTFTTFLGTAGGDLDAGRTFEGPLDDVQIRDFDGDGHPDLFGFSRGPRAFVVRRGYGDGTWAAPVEYPTPLSLYGALLTDLDADGDPDALGFYIYSDSLVIGWNDGAGRFSAMSVVPAGDGHKVESIAAGRFDGDPFPDLVYSTWNSISGYEATFVRPGDGGGAFLEATRLSGGADGQLQILDYDGDGMNDLIIAGGSVFLYRGRGDGTFEEPTVIPTSGVGRAAVFDDLNGDGLPDVVTPTGFGAAVAFGRPEPGPAMFPLPHRARTLTLVDLTGDGHLDAIGKAGSQSAPLFYVRQGDGTGSFGPMTTFEAETYYGNPVFPDLTGDGIPDLAAPLVSFTDTSIRYETFLSFRPGLGDGSFGPAQEWNVGHSVLGLKVVDVGNDGGADLLVQCGDAIFLYLDGAGTPMPLDLPEGSSTGYILSGDFDADRRTDLILTRSREFVFLPGHGDGTFGPPVVTPVGESIYGIAAAGLDGDGAVELLLGTYDELIRMKYAGGSFVEVERFPEPGLVRFLQAADLNGDGRQDLIIGRETGDLSVRAGLGHGLYADEQHVGLPVSLGPLVEDVDEDGRADLAFVDRSGSLRVSRNEARFDAPSLEAVARGLDVTLSWSPSGDDTGSWTVYRIGEDETAFEALTASPLPGGSTEFHDTSVSRPGLWTYQVRRVDGCDGETPYTEVNVTLGPPAVMRVLSVAPNPSSAAVHATVEIPAAGDATLDVFDVGGRLVRHRDLGTRVAGRHEIVWDGTNEVGESAASGLYFLRVTARGGAATARAVIVR